MKQRSIVIVLLLSSLLSGMSAAGVYRWVDAQGRVHFGDRPPQGQGRALDLPAAAAGAGVPEKVDHRARQRRYLESLEAERRSREQERQRRQARAQARQARCEQARARLQRYRTLSSLYEELPDGKRRYLSAAEHRQVIDDARARVARWCD